MIKIDLKRYRREVVGGVIVLLLLIGGISVFKYTSFNSGFEIVDDLGGNIFPSAILSVATTDAQVITPSDSTCCLLYTSYESKRLLSLRCIG